MNPPNLMRLPDYIGESLSRMRCGERQWTQDEDLDVHITAPVRPESISAHYHFIWVWCGTRFALWSFVLVNDGTEEQEDDEGG